jgi:hypothetical protein
LILRRVMVVATVPPTNYLSIGLPSCTQAASAHHTLRLQIDTPPRIDPKLLSNQVDKELIIKAIEKIGDVKLVGDESDVELYVGKWSSVGWHPVSQKFIIFPFWEDKTLTDPSP